MPVTARLSKKFYDTWGEELAQDLVDWFNQVDATYRSDLRELNELNFQRFDAKLEQRLAEQDARWGAQLARLETKLDQRLTELDVKWRGQWDRLDAKLNQRLAELDGEWQSQWERLDAKLEHRSSRLEHSIATLQTGLRAEFATGLARQKADLTRLMFGFWVATLVPLAGLIFALHGGLG